MLRSPLTTAICRPMDRYFEFASNHVLLTVGLVLSFFMLLFSELQRKARNLTSVEPQDVVKLINADALVVDVRSAEAYAKGHIVNARNIPFDEFDAQASKLDGMKKQAIVAVCDAGSAANRAVDRLQKAGIEKVYALRGGMTAWSEAGLPVVGGKKLKKKR
ncbi:MAG: rhodanese-like domain-containing protein [Woeseia sp.]|nr:rhodanese-like domain-containing protein [Woeseia sp.]NNE59617.1 rhodanese-like domain-containing protein [Woeseia sp.]NNL55768.1 rhodanese-like domain-containing protein [Woeseia sp.]